MAHIHWPLVGDPIYGGRFQMPPACSEKLEQALRSFKRQALHAEKLGITHPVSGDYCEWEQALPDDMADLVTALQENDRQ